MWNIHDSKWPDLNMLIINAMVFVPVASLFSPKVYNFCRFAQEGLPSKQPFVDISVFLWLRKQRPRFAQGQPKGYFQLKELHRTTKPYSQVNAD